MARILTLQAVCLGQETSPVRECSTTSLPAVEYRIGERSVICPQKTIRTLSFPVRGGQLPLRARGTMAYEDMTCKFLSHLAAESIGTGVSFAHRNGGVNRVQR